MKERIAAIFSEPRAPGALAPFWQDWVLVAVIILVSIVDGLIAENLLWRSLTIVVSASLALTLAWRRTHTLLMVGIVAGVIGVVQSIAYLNGFDWNGLDSNVIYFLVFAYALVRWGAGREAILGVAVLGIPFLTTISVEMQSWTEILGAILFYLFPAALGASVRYQDKAQRRSREQLRLQEREQLARELHDTVAHHVSAIAVQAQAGQALAATQPQAPLEILGIIEEAASRTLSEMRHIVHVLRDDTDVARTPTATLADIKRLAHDTTCPLEISIDFTGKLDDLDTTLESTLYRLVQESVTNAVRHARGARSVDVRITGEDEQVRLAVCDDGEWVAQRPPPGLGLRGMTERVALFGGTLRAAPGASRGWLVEATLPRQRV